MLSRRISHIRLGSLLSWVISMRRLSVYEAESRTLYRSARLLGDALKHVLNAPVRCLQGKG